MTGSLHPCVACNRHIKSSEVACPFCGAAAPAQHAPRVALPPGRLSRAALLALGTLAAAPVACGGQAESDDRNDSNKMGDGDGDGDAGDGDNNVAIYGAPATGGSDPGYGGGPVYGAPPTNAGGTPSDGGSPNHETGGEGGAGGDDGTDTGTGGDIPIPVYGLAPPQD